VKKFLYCGVYVLLSEFNTLHLFAVGTQASKTKMQCPRPKSNLVIRPHFQNPR